MRLYRLRLICALCFTTILATQVVVLAASSEEKPQEKPIVAVYDLKGSGVAEPIVNALTERIHDEVFHRGLYRVVARTDIEDVFKEQGFQLSGACDDSSYLIEVGRILGANFIIGGSIALIEENYTVSIRIVNVETGEVVKSFSSSKYYNATTLLNRGAVEIVDHLVSPKGKFAFLTSPYFWGGAAVTVAAGTAIYLQMTKEDTPSETPAGTAQVVVTFP